MKYTDDIKSGLDEFNGDWTIISSMDGLPEDVIREYQYRVDWKIISSEQPLSESFIREFQDKVDWFFISSHQNLSESFIEEFKDKVNWKAISISQSLSLDFVVKHCDYLDVDYLIRNDKIDVEDLEKRGLLVAVKLAENKLK